MKNLIASLFIAMLCGPVWADGVPLITARPPAAAALNPAISLWQKQDGFVRVHTVTFNKNAFGSHVLLVEIDGKQRRFVGRMGKPYANGTLNWSGSDGKGLLDGGALLSLIKMPDGTLGGTVDLVSRSYEIRPQKDGTAALIETDLSARKPTPTVPPSMLKEQPK